MGKEEEEEEEEEEEQQQQQQQQGLQLLDFDWKLKVFELSPISQLCEMKSVVAFFFKEGFVLGERCSGGVEFFFV
jgi:hypothetical protein